MDAKASCYVLRSLALIKYTFQRWADLRTRLFAFLPTEAYEIAPPSGENDSSKRHEFRLMSGHTSIRVYWSFISESMNQMDQKIVAMIALGAFALVIGLGELRQAEAQEAKTPYPSMAPLDQYLIANRNAEIALAWTAAPPSISQNATVMVLGRHGYETAVEGNNGFVCMVERAWMSSFHSPEFWNPKNRGPLGFNPPAARSILPLTLKRTDLVLAGLSKAQIIDGIKAFQNKELPALEPGGMTYMMSRQGYLNDSAGHRVPHLMFYVALRDAMTWGADAPGSPVLLNPHFNGAPEPVTEFMIPVSEWSDGTQASTDAH